MRWPWPGIHYPICAIREALDATNGGWLLPVGCHQMNEIPWQIRVFRAIFPVLAGPGGGDAHTRKLMWWGVRWGSTQWHRSRCRMKRQRWTNYENASMILLSLKNNEIYVIWEPFSVVMGAGGWRRGWIASRQSLLCVVVAFLSFFFCSSRFRSASHIIHVGSMLAGGLSSKSHLIVRLSWNRLWRCHLQAPSINWQSRKLS